MVDAKNALPTVLLVEDNSTAMRMQVLELEKAGPFKVISAKDGIMALDLLRQSKVDAVVTDLRMPRMDGFELVAALSTRYPGLPIFVLTSVPDAAELDPTLKETTLRIHAKPPDYQELATEIRASRLHPQGATRGISVPGLLQLLQWEQRDATITVHSGERLGWLYVRGGHLVQAEEADLQGLAAAFAMCLWPRPWVEFVDTCRVEGAFNLSAEGLQMELAIRRDEAQSGSGEAP